MSSLLLLWSLGGPAREAVAAEAAKLRYVVAIYTLALAGSFVGKKIVPVSEGTLRDHRPLFIFWLVFVVVVIGALSYFPALALGPIVEYLIQIGRGTIHV